MAYAKSSLRRHRRRALRLPEVHYLCIESRISNPTEMRTFHTQEGLRLTPLWTVVPATGDAGRPVKSTTH